MVRKVEVASLVGTVTYQLALEDAYLDEQNHRVVDSSTYVGDTCVALVQGVLVVVHRSELCGSWEVLVHLEQHTWQDRHTVVGVDSTLALPLLVDLVAFLQLMMMFPP